MRSHLRERSGTLGESRRKSNAIFGAGAWLEARSIISLAGR